MTEQEWLDAESPGPLLDFLEGEAVTLVDRVPPEQREAMSRHLLGLASDRKRYFLACAFARRVWPLLADERSRQAVVVAERFADGLADGKEGMAAISGALQARDAIRVDSRSGDRAAGQAVRWAARTAVMAVLCDVRAAAEESALALERASSPTPADAQRELAALVRDVMGNPFRPSVVEQRWLAWNEGTVLRLAEAVYAKRAFEQLPVLADALEDAGCNNAEILGHLRGPGPHALGCWCLDALLGKT
jgi:hypothetical protein